MATNHEYSDLKKQLQKTLTVMKEFASVFKDQESNSRKRIQSVANLTEQLRSCVKVDQLDLPVLIEFPDVREKLVNKLTTDITDDLQQLKLNLQQLTCSYEGFHKQFDQCLVKFNKYNKQDSLPQLTKQTAVCPSLSDMVEMVEQTDRRLEASCLCKKYILEEFYPEMYKGTDSFEMAWFEGDSLLLNEIQDCLVMTTFFMEEKIS